MRLYRWCVRATARGQSYPVSLHWWLWGARRTLARLRAGEQERRRQADRIRYRWTGITYEVGRATDADRAALKAGAVL